jgi:hypothetical protein
MDNEAFPIFEGNNYFQQALLWQLPILYNFFIGRQRSE